MAVSGVSEFAEKGIMNVKFNAGVKWFGVPDPDGNLVRFFSQLRD